MPVIEIGHDVVYYHFNRENDIKFIKIYLDDLNGIVVTAPCNKSRHDAELFLKKKADWINEKWTKLHHDLYQLSFSSIMYLGRRYKVIPLEITDQSSSSFIFSKGKFIFSYSKHLEADEREDLYKRKTAEWLKKKSEQRFKQLSAVSSADDYRLGRKDRGSIHLNWRLVKRSKKHIQTVIDDLKNEKTY
ncbi:YgjP-like metallopeptidase domain-containing protein [Halobacillus sp. A5]|uniref:YgjP-like metallopeptidase domain-containing protein n=1 Tax=Halobacillus sp. A5 TaxID=2880263 RepID=UPI0020A6C43F|nr:YgjP-like metallopeptidase domain-containing protein [Halobacillus sp. A5]MCP3026348.1 M48 family metallopeptidase [Halobacillus sp. A5]